MSLKPADKPESNSISPPEAAARRWSNDQAELAKSRTSGGKPPVQSASARAEDLAATVTAEIDPPASALAAKSSEPNSPAKTDRALSQAPNANGSAAASQAAPPIPPVPSKRKTARERILERDQTRRVSLRLATSSWLLSAVVNMSLLLLIAWARFSSNAAPSLVSLISSTAERDTNSDTQNELDTQFEPTDEPATDLTTVEPEVTDTTDVTDTELVDAPAPGTMDQVDPTNVAVSHSIHGELLERIGGAFAGTGMAIRGDAGRQQALSGGGATPESELAVAQALKWLATHQNKDGSWCFDHRGGACQGRCKNQGQYRSRTVAATAMGVLPFLGAGQTHKEGQYKKVVEQALYFLTGSMVMSSNGGDLTQSHAGGQMYDHGLAAIALTEAFAMTQDKDLYPYAQQALNFIVYAQNQGGGWRYMPHDLGDTSVVGWQLMALKSGSMGGLAVPMQTYRGAYVFLNTVQGSGGATYGYTGPGSGPATNPVGLLCRMYLGWKHDEPALQEGVKLIAASGPYQGNMYANYYATQVLRHYGGEEWKLWNEKMREQLVKSQDKSGHEAGSWFNCSAFGGIGGRLYCTSLSCMTLEVYYRHMPLYQEVSTEDDMEGLGE